MTGKDTAARDRAWAAFSANLVVLPGLGSLLMRRRAGWLQAPLALAGMALNVRWLLLVLLDWRHAGALPDTIPHAGLLLEGVSLFAVAWVWALGTGLAVLRRVRSDAAARDDTV